MKYEQIYYFNKNIQKKKEKNLQAIIIEMRKELACIKQRPTRII